MVNRFNDTTGIQSSRADYQDDLWQAYNSLLLSADRSRIRKLLVRYRLFEQSLEVPGDIVECGVFKGIGLMYWARLLEIFAPNSKKLVIGFDTFAPFDQVPLQAGEEDVAARHIQISEGIGKADIVAAIEAAGFSHRIELNEGDIAATAMAYVTNHYGFRISLLHLDLDTYAGTKAALTAFWPVVSRGGIVVFDEYGLTGMGESQAVDEFFSDMNVWPLTVSCSETPTAYLIKP